jgi:uncharacterized SAM-binding protein YcdF (DUF218 family)
LSSLVPEALRADVETLWDYNNMHHELRPVDVGIGLGSHDLGVAIHTTDLYHRGIFPRVVFTGANAPTTVDRFPLGEAIHYHEYAVAHGVPDQAILVESTATNTSENIERTRKLLLDSCIDVKSMILVSRPYQQRRAYATAKKIWPEVDAVCTSLPLSIDEYVKSIGDSAHVISMIVGDTQRLAVYADKGFSIPQQIPENVQESYHRLVSAGFVSRLL